MAGMPPMGVAPPGFRGRGRGIGMGRGRGRGKPGAGKPGPGAGKPGAGVAKQADVVGALQAYALLTTIAGTSGRSIPWN